MDVQSATDVPTGMDVPPGTDVTMRTDAPTGVDVPATTGGSPILTYGGDIQRTLSNRAETRLTIAAVRTAGRLGKDIAFHPPTLDGAIYTAPLYLPAQTLAGGTHDVIFVATQGDTVWALDAATGSMLWHTNLGTPVLRTQQPCGNISPQTGVQGGMVIDPATHTLFAVAYTRAGGANVFTINALDTLTGAQHAGYPQPITPAASNGSTWVADPQGERGAITFVGGRIYVPFGGLWGDCGPYHGWVVGIDPATPTHQTSFATSGSESGIWAPAGIASDGTHLFAATGNGVDPSPMGEYVIRFDTGPTGPTMTTGTSSYFTPSDRVSLDRGDTDIGSNGPVVLPDQTGTTTPHLLFQGGKSGIGYLLNRDNLGGMGMGDGTHNEGVFSAQVSNGGVYGATAAWSDGTHTYVFVPVQGGRPAPCSGSLGVVALRLGAVAGGASNFSTAWCTASGAEGAPAVSSNGNSDGILWVATAGSTTVRAYDISTGMMIWSANDAATIRKWVPPLVVDGRVFVTGTNTLTMYRLLH
jgi:outer membrane protein assembly factor BamB